MKDAEATVHDMVLAAMAPEARTEHLAGDCPFCAGTEGAPVGSEQTYSEAEVEARIEAALTKATASLTARIAELESSHQQSEFDAAVAEATAPLQAQLAELQSQLDTAMAEVAAATAALEASAAAAAAAAAERETAELIAGRRETRLAAVREVITFPEEFLAASAERWAAMDDEAFATQLAEYRAVHDSLPPSVLAAAGTGGPPRTTAMTAAAGGAPGTRSPSGQLQRQALELLRTGHVPAGA